MKTSGKFKGVVVPMITPVNVDGSIDTEAVKIIIGSFVKAGVHPLLMGTTGEGNSVGYEEAKVLVKTAAQAAEGKITIYAGLNGCVTSHHIESANEYHKLGADVIVATLPSYYALTPDQMFTYYKTLADNVTAPLMLYNILATTHMTIPVEIVEKLSRHPSIVGLKDSERDLDRMMQCLDISTKSETFSYFIGWAAQSAHSLANGADGIVPSTGNFTPRSFRDLYDAATKGDMDTAVRLQEDTDLVAKIYQSGRTLGQSLAALKVMMKTRGLCQAHMLSPLTPLGVEEAAAVAAEAKRVTLS